MNTRQPFIIMSAELVTLSDEENTRRTEAMSKWLDAKGYAHKPVIGCYKGKQEVSFVIPFTSDKESTELYRLAIRAYGQESILYVDANRYATLARRDGQNFGLGQFRAVNKEDATKREAFTHDIMEDRYYVAG